MYLIPLVTLQMWMNDVKYNQVLNQTLVPPGVNSQATLQYTKSFKLAVPFVGAEHLLWWLIAPSATRRSLNEAEGMCRPLVAEGGTFSAFIPGCIFTLVFSFITNVYISTYIIYLFSNFSI